MRTLSTRMRVAYSAPALALAGLALLLNAFLPKFYTDSVGVNVGFVATTMIAVRLFDAFTDPLIGVLSDRTPGRFGRRRPWILLASLPLAFTFVLLLNPSWHGGMSLESWLMSLVFAFTLFWTALSIPYEALGAALSDDYDERTDLFGMREIFLLVGTVLAAASPVVLRAVMDLGVDRPDQLELFRTIAWIWAALTLALAVGCALLVPERHSEVVQRPFNVMGVVRESLSNRSFRVLLIAYTVAAFGNNLPATMVLYYAQYVIGTEHGDRILLLYMVVAISGMPLWIRAAHRFGKKAIWLASLGMTVGVFVWAIPLGPGDLWPFVAIAFLTGAAGGAVVALPHAMQPDVIDEDELETGQRREGQYIGLWSIAKKVSAALGVGLGLKMLDMAGYQPNGVQPESVKMVLRLTYIVIPCLCFALAMLIGSRYPLDRERHLEIRRRIEARRTL